MKVMSQRDCNRSMYMFSLVLCLPHIECKRGGIIFMLWHNFTIVIGAFLQTSSSSYISNPPQPTFPLPHQTFSRRLIIVFHVSSYIYMDLPFSLYLPPINACTYIYLRPLLATENNSLCIFSLFDIMCTEKNACQSLWVLHVQLNCVEDKLPLKPSLLTLFLCFCKYIYFV